MVLTRMGLSNGTWPQQVSLCACRLKFEANINGFQYVTHLHSIQIVTFVVAILAVTEPTVFGVGYAIHALALFAFPQRSIHAIAFKKGQQYQHGICVIYLWFVSGWWWYSFKCWANMVLVMLIVVRSFDAFQQTPRKGHKASSTLFKSTATEC